MGIEILPPDINEGESGFSAKGNSIRYGLTAIKNVGKNIIDGIVEEREKHGKYTDLEDFITRTANLGVNKRAIENFIKAGAFDSLNATRKQMMMVYIQILDGVNKENKDAWEGQMSIFDMADDSTKEKYKVKMPDVGEYTVDQKLAFEKEVIGIYASGHPLQAQEQKWRKHITNMSIDFTEPEEGEESKVPDKSKVAVGGIISAITKKFTKTGQQMAFITLEDLVGTVEVVVFPRQFERSRMLMEEGQKIFVKGEANIEENSAGKVLANSIVSFDQVPSELWIAFKDKEEYMAKEKELLETLLLHKGGDKVMIALAKERQQKHSAQKSPLLADGTENEIGMFLRHETVFDLGPFEEALAPEVARTDGDFRLVDVVVEIAGIVQQPEVTLNAVLLVLLENRVEDVVGGGQKDHRPDEEAYQNEDIAQIRTVGVNRNADDRQQADDQQAVIEVEFPGGNQRCGCAEQDARQRQHGQKDDPRAPHSIHHRLREGANQNQRDEQGHRREQERDDEQRGDQQDRDAEPFVQPFAVEHEKERPQHDARPGVVLQDDDEERNADHHGDLHQVARAVDREGVVAHHARQCQRRGDLDEFDGLDAQRPQFDP